jgi:hypothetical protein
MRGRPLGHPLQSLGIRRGPTGHWSHILIVQSLFSSKLKYLIIFESNSCPRYLDEPK